MKKFFRQPVSRLALFICLSLISIGATGQEIDHWESLVKTGGPVKYLAPEGPVPAEWILPDFEDATWTDGINGVGYGDDDDNTVDTAVSVYVRNRFNLTNTDVIGSLMLDMGYDDGFVAYLNGVEIARANMGDANSPTTWDQLTPIYVNEAPIGTYRYALQPEDIELLAMGENLLCVEVHNHTQTSSDLSSNTYLSAGITDSNTYYAELPSWFIAPKEYVSRIPIMSINTNGQEIIKESRIVAHMGLIYNGDQQEHFPTDSFNYYDGRISIKIRGSSSTGFNKKSFTIETQTDSGTNNNVILLGLPRENDFVLYAPYSDKSLLRNVISYKVHEAMGHWAPRTRFINLYLNGEYHGIYVLTERVKVDRNRLDLKGLSPEDVTETDISGGYLLQQDRTNLLGWNEYWTSPVDPLYGWAANTFEYSDPERHELTDAQAAYIRNWVNDLDALMASSNFDDPETGYRAYMDVRSFADYLILHELNKDVDAFRLSTYFHKKSDLNGGKFFAGPVWDYNLAFGNVDYGPGDWNPDGFLYPSASRYWWQRLMEDPYFYNAVLCRWDAMKSTILNQEAIESIIDSSITYLGSSIEHNFERWPVLGVYIWPNYFVGNSYQQEVAYLKQWIFNRLDWIDAQWGGRCVSTGTLSSTIQAPRNLIIYPNPSDLTNVRITVPNHRPGICEVELFGLRGQLVYASSHALGPYSGSMILDDLSFLEKGIYLLSVRQGERTWSEKLIRQ